MGQRVGRGHAAPEPGQDGVAASFRERPIEAPHTGALVAVDTLLPTFEAYGATIATVLSDSSREFCGREDQHPYELFLQLEAIAHKTTQVRRPQSNGIVDRLRRTLLDEHIRIEGRRTGFETIEEMHVALDGYLEAYDTKRPHQDRGMAGRTPSQAFSEGLPRAPTKEGHATASPPKIKAV